MKRLFAVLVLSTTSSFVSSALAQQAPVPMQELVGRQGGLTSDEAARRASATSYEVRAKNKAVLAAAAEVDKALVAWFPRLTLTARYTRVSDIDQPALGRVVVAPTAGEGLLPPGTPLANAPISFPVVLDHYLLQANVIVPLSDYALRTGQGYSATRQAREAAKLEAEAARRGAATQARLVYYAWVRARLQEQVARQALEQAQAHLRRAEAALQAERASRADVLAAKARVSSAQLLAERAGNLAVVTEDQLRTLMHDPDERHYQIGENVAVPSRASDDRRPIRELVAEAERRRPEFRAIDARMRALRQSERVARASSYPRLDAFGNLYYANPNPRYVPQQDEWHATWDVGVQLTWSPNDLGSSSATSSALEAQRAQLKAQKAALKDSVRGELVAARQALREANAAVATASQGEQSAREAERARVAAFELGKATSVEVIDAETDLLLARLELVNAYVDQRVARAELDHALGR